MTSVSLSSAGAAATATVAGSPYTISVSNAVGTGLGNYTITYNDATVGFTVNRKALSITADNQTKTYGTAYTFDETTPGDFSVSGLVNGDTVTSVSLSSAGAAATATVAGSPYTISVSNAVGTGLGNYTITYNDATVGFTVNRKALSITADNQTKTYGTAYTFDETTPGDFSVSGLVNGDTVTSVSLSSAGAAATATVAGSPYTISVSNAVGTGLGNYTITYNDATVGFTVNRKALSITADNQTKTYGTAYTFDETTPGDFSVSGLVNGDTVTSVSLSSAGAAATATVAGSPYTISVSNAVGTGLGNYTITYNDATVGFTVNRKALSITADNQTKTYGTAYTFDETTPGDFSVSGLVNGDTVTSVSLSSAGAAATATVAGSPYTISVSNAVGTGLGNYTITYNDATVGFTVNRKALSITADDPTKTYGAAYTFDALHERPDAVRRAVRRRSPSQPHRRLRAGVRDSRDVGRQTRRPPRRRRGKRPDRDAQRCRDRSGKDSHLASEFDITAYLRPGRTPSGCAWSSGPTRRTSRTRINGGTVVSRVRCSCTRPRRLPGRHQGDRGTRRRSRRPARSS